jgi:hypothetical protein
MHTLWTFVLVIHGGSKFAIKPKTVSSQINFKGCCDYLLNTRRQHSEYDQCRTFTKMPYSNHKLVQKRPEVRLVQESR